VESISRRRNMKEVVGEILCRIEKDTRKPVLNVVAIARNG
jgi:hypothetical protein